MVKGKKRHVFYSSVAARAFSLFSNDEAQAVLDLIKEMSSAVNVSIVTEEESIISLLKSGAPIEDIVTIKALQEFLRITGGTSKVHRVTAEDSSEKKIEKYSEINVNYYKLISNLGKSEAEDFGEFINLFPLKHDLSSDYISHIPRFLKAYDRLFPTSWETSKTSAKVRKRRFSDYLAEIRWTVREVLEADGTKGIVVPDDYFAVGIAKELEMFGVRPSVASPVSEIYLNDAPYNFAISAIRCIEEDFSFEHVISILENPYSNIDPSKLYRIKQHCYEKNITRGLRDWETLFRELKIGDDILRDLEGVSRDIGNQGGIKSLMAFLDKYLGEGNHPGKILRILLSAFEGYSNDASGLINDMESLKYLPRVNISGDLEVIVGKPLDLLGLPLDNLFIVGLDAASSLRSFPQEARDFLAKIELEDGFENLMDLAYKTLLSQSERVVLSYSFQDEKLGHTEPIAFYDEISGVGELVTRDSIFIPQNPLLEWELGRDSKISIDYFLDKAIIRERMEKPIYPTFIENYAGCHFKGFVNGLLGVDEIDPPREFLDPRTTGSLTHRILEMYYSTDLPPASFRKLADSYIKGEIAREKYESRTEALKFYREKYLATGKLVKFFSMDVQRSLELGRRTIQKEFHFPTNEQQVYYEFSGERMSIGGYVDRVDEQGEGLCIIDYKSSLYGYPKNDLCDEKHYKVQLFFYKLGVEAVLKKKVKAAAYVSFKDTNDGFSTAGFFNSIPNEEAQVRKCIDIINPVLQDFVNGDVDPVVKEGGNLWKCENELFCPLLSVCRVQERRW